MSIRAYEEKGKKFFRVRVSLWNRKRTFKVQKQKTGITTERRAKDVEKELTRLVLEEITKRETLGVLWGELINQWELHLRKGFNLGRKIEKTTAQDHVAALRLYTPKWFKVPASQITKAQVRVVLDRMTNEGKSNSRKKAVKNAINSCFEWGLETGKITGVQQSPAFGVKIANKEESKPEILNLSEIKTFLATAMRVQHPWYHVWAFALLTGMRSGEIYALEWSDVDWDNKRLTVSKSFNKRLNTIKSTKAGHWRDVPISTELMVVLKELKDTSGGRKQVLPRIREWYRGEAARVLRAFCEGYGLKSIKFHTLRACFATQLIKDNVAPAIVMKICGWRDLKTMQRYIRLAGIEIEGATESLKLLTPRETMENVVQLFSK